jgi:6-phosphogluconolactonase (cycloisomerase 2 family)
MMKRELSFRREVRLRSLSAVALALILSGTGSARASERDEKEPSTSVVYVESNLPDNNSVLAFRRDDDGRLSKIGEFPTGGKGVFDPSLQLGPFDSDQELITNAEHTLLFAVNPGSDSIAVFQIQRDGSLTPVNGSPFSSGGTNPVSVGVAGNTLVVVNKAFDPERPALKIPSYSSFRILPNGELSSQLSSVPAPTKSSPSQADISSDTRLAFDAQFLGGFLQSFVIEPDGTLTASDHLAAPASLPGSKAAPLPLGLATHPKLPILYVDFVTVSRIGVYRYDSAGHLEFVTSAADSGAAPCWTRMNSDGTRLYASNTGDTSISVFDTTSPLDPEEIQHLKLRGQGNTFEIELDPTGNFLYAITQRASATTALGQGNTLHVLRVDRETGKVDEDESPLEIKVPNGVRPQGVAVVEVISDSR